MDHGPLRREENKVTSSVYIRVCASTYGTKEEEEDIKRVPSVSKKGNEEHSATAAKVRQRETTEEGEREAVDRGRAESGRASERKTKIRDEERGERGQPPLLPRVVTPNAGDISTNQITPRAPPFIIILLVFPLLHPHWMTFPGPYRGTKKAPAPRRGLHASSRGLVSSGTLLVPTLVQQRPPPEGNPLPPLSRTRSLPVLCTWNLYAML